MLNVCCESCDISEKNVVLLFIIGIVIRYHVLLSVCCESCDISEKNVVLLFIIGIVIRYHVLFMLVK